MASAALLAACVLGASIACGRSGLDAFSLTGETPTPTATATPTATPSGQPTSIPTTRAPAPGDVSISEIFVRDEADTASDANLSTTTAGGDDRFIEVVNVSTDFIVMDGVTITIDNGDGTPVIFESFAGLTLAPRKGIAIFNKRMGVDFTALRAKTGDAAIAFATGPGDISTNMDNTDPAFVVEIRATDQALLFHLSANRNANQIVVFADGDDVAAYDGYQITVAADPCADIFCNTNSGVYSLAVPNALALPGPANRYDDHRLIDQDASKCTDLSTDFPCCSMSPGRWFDPTNPEDGCRKF